MSIPWLTPILAAAGIAGQGASLFNHTEAPCRIVGEPGLGSGTPVTLTVHTLGQGPRTLHWNPSGREALELELGPRSSLHLAHGEDPYQAVSVWFEIRVGLDDPAEGFLHLQRDRPLFFQDPAPARLSGYFYDADPRLPHRITRRGKTDIVLEPRPEPTPIRTCVIL